MGAEFSCSSVYEAGLTDLPIHQINVYHVTGLKTTYNTLVHKHFTNSSYIDRSTLIQVLPFDINLSHVVTHLFNNEFGMVHWKHCLGGLLLCVSGSVTEKLHLLFQMHNLQRGGIHRNSFESLLMSLFSSAVKIYNSDWEGKNLGLNRTFFNVNYVVKEIIDDTYKDKNGSLTAADILSWAESQNFSWTMNILGNEEEKNGLIVTNRHSAELGSPTTSRKHYTYCWTGVAPQPSASVPNSRSKHVTCFHDGKIYLHGGKDGSVTMKDVWQYDIASNIWTQLSCHGDKPGSLHEHTMVPYKGKLYVFGGEYGSSDETPLWILDLDSKRWIKHELDSEVTTPTGRRSHSAVAYNKAMYIYGGYVDLKGSNGELWTFDFEGEMWHLAHSIQFHDDGPGARHKHSAVVHDNSMWVYGGMTDLQPRADFWKWSFRMRTWTKIKCKISPPDLCGHSACKLLDGILIFGGESEGVLQDDIWKYHFGSQSWQKVSCYTQTPPARSNHSSLTVSSIYLNPPETDRTNSMPYLRSASPVNDVPLSRPFSSPPYISVPENQDSLHPFKNRVSPIPSPSQTDWEALTKNFSEANELSTSSVKRKPHGTGDDSSTHVNNRMDYYRLMSEDSSTESDTNAVTDNNAEQTKYDNERKTHLEYLRNISTTSDDRDLLDSVTPMDKSNRPRCESTTSDLGVDNPMFSIESNSGTEEDLTHISSESTIKWVEKVSNQTMLRESDDYVMCLKKNFKELYVGEHKNGKSDIKNICDSFDATETIIPGLIRSETITRRPVQSFNGRETSINQTTVIDDDNPDDDKDEEEEIFGANLSSDLIITDVDESEFEIDEEQFDHWESNDMACVIETLLSAREKSNGSLDNFETNSSSDNGKSRVINRQRERNKGTENKTPQQNHREDKSIHISQNVKSESNLSSYIKNDTQFEKKASSNHNSGKSLDNNDTSSKTERDIKQQRKRHLPAIPPKPSYNASKCNYKLSELLDKRKVNFSPVALMNVKQIKGASQLDASNLSVKCQNNDTTSNKRTLPLNSVGYGRQTLPENDEDSKNQMTRQTSMPVTTSTFTHSHTHDKSSNIKQQTKNHLPGNSMCVFVFGGREKDAHSHYTKPLTVWRCDVMLGKPSNTQIQKLIRESTHLKTK